MKYSVIFLLMLCCSSGLEQSVDADVSDDVTCYKNTAYFDHCRSQGFERSYICVNSHYEVVEELKQIPKDIRPTCEFVSGILCCEGYPFFKTTTDH